MCWACEAEFVVLAKRVCGTSCLTDLFNWLAD